MADIIQLKDYERVLVVGARGSNLTHEWKDDSRVIVWEGDKEANAVVPQNVKAILYTRFLDHKVTNMLAEVARDRKLLLFPMLHTGEVKKTLARFGIGEIATDGKIITPKEQTTARKGEIKLLVEQEADLGKPTTEEARRLYEIAKERGIMTTPESVGQRISQMKRERGLSGTVQSVQPKKSEEQAVLDAFDDAIAALQLAREGFRRIVQEGKDAKATVTKLREALGVK